MEQRSASTPATTRARASTSEPSRGSPGGDATVAAKETVISSPPPLRVEDASTPLQEDTASSPRRLRGSLPDRLEVVVPLVVYLAIVITGLTTSSLGISSLREDPTRPLGSMVGETQSIRSDEWRTQTALELGTIALGEPNVSPLAHDPDLVFQLTSGNIFESVLFAEATLLSLGPWLPDAMVFSAFRAFTWLLLALTLPPLLRRFGATRTLSWLGFALCFLAPTSLWWSWTPIRILGFTSAGCYLLVIAHGLLARQRKALATVAAAAGGILLARLGTFYIPWCITIGLPLALGTAGWLLTRRPRRTGAVVLGTGVLGGAVVLAGAVAANWDALQATLATAYPGQRASSGAALSVFQLLGAPGLFEAARGAPPVLLNSSELASGYLVCGVWAGLLWRHMDPAARDGSRVVVHTLAACLAVWTAWVTIGWGGFGGHLPLLNRVPAERAGQTVGYLAVLLLVLVLCRVPERRARSAAVPAAAVCAALTAYGLSDLQRALPELGVGAVWGVAAIVGLLCWAATRFSRRAAPTVAIAVAAALAGLHVNPLIFGVGDLRDSRASEVVREYARQARAESVNFVTDSGELDVLTVGNGAPSITGYQVTGPRRAAWRVLDPTGRYEENWNRGASYLIMAFDGPEDGPPVIDNVGRDVIYVHVDPCWLVEQSLDVGYLLSAAELRRPCLRVEEHLLWGGVPTYLYSLRER